MKKIKQKYVTAIFNKHFESITSYLNLFSSPEVTLMSLGNDTSSSISKKFAFRQSIKAINEKLKIKSEFLFSHVSTETIKRITNEYV